MQQYMHNDNVNAHTKASLFFQFASMEDNKNLRLTSPNISATTFSLDFFFFSFFSFFSVFFLK